MATSAVDFSQFGEQPILEQWAGGRLGTFLEIGAYDGVSYSNTRALMLAGWQGICVEPAPDMAAQLREAVAGYPVSVWELACVPEPPAGRPERLPLRWTRGQPFSTLNPRVGLETGSEEIAVGWVDCETLVRQLQGRPRPWLLSLDAEGTTLGLLARFLQLERFDALVVEAHEALPDERAVCHALLLYGGYRVLAENPVNVLAVCT